MFEDEKEIHMKTTGMIAKAAVLIVGNGLALQMTRAQQPGVKRIDLQRHNLSVPGREAQVRVELGPGVTSPDIRIRARRSSMSSKARWNMRSRARRR
jgi:hypothetical protein